jgi:hypothetical protein
METTARKANGKQPRRIVLSADCGGKGVQGSQWKQKGLDFLEGENLGNQYLPRESNRAMYISRMECVETAVGWNLDKRALETPRKKIAICTFNSCVEFLGDCTQGSVKIEGDRLLNFDAIWNAGIKYDSSTLGSAEDTIARIKETVSKLQECGATALGPALLFSVAVASRFARSEVILVTDGNPNVGLGSLEESEAQSKEFFASVAKLAKANSTKVSVIGIQSQEPGSNEGCGLKTVAAVAEQTGGAAETLHPLELITQMVRISQNPVLGMFAHLCAFD